KIIFGLDSNSHLLWDQKDFLIQRVLYLIGDNEYLIGNNLCRAKNYFKLLLKNKNKYVKQLFDIVLKESNIEGIVNKLNEYIKFQLNNDKNNIEFWKKIIIRYPDVIKYGSGTIANIKGMNCILKGIQKNSNHIEIYSFYFMLKYNNNGNEQSLEYYYSPNCTRKGASYICKYKNNKHLRLNIFVNENKFVFEILYLDQNNEDLYKKIIEESSNRFTWKEDKSYNEKSILYVDNKEIIDESSIESAIETFKEIKEIVDVHKYLP
nr:hypothetical protein [Spirochaetota bacterium]